MAYQLRKDPLRRHRGRLTTWFGRQAIITRYLTRVHYPKYEMALGSPNLGNMVSNYCGRLPLTMTASNKG